MSLHDIFKRYHDKVQFIMIYIREAHPVDGWWLGGGLQGKLIRMAFPHVSTDLYDPKSIQERRAAAGQCEKALRYGIRTFVDTMDDSVNKAYAAYPTRLYLVGRDGHIVYAGALGPFGFKPAELDLAIKEHLVAEAQCRI